MGKDSKHEPMIIDTFLPKSEEKEIPSQIEEHQEDIERTSSLEKAIELSQKPQYDDETSNKKNEHTFGANQ